AFALVALLAPAVARAQTTGASGSTTRTAARPPRPLSLDAALDLGERQSESVRIADAAVTRARGQVIQARSAYFPQLSGSGSYQRQVQSQFQALANQAAASAPAFTAQTPVSLCTPTIAANATPADRTAALAAAQTCPSSAGGGIGSLTKAFANPNTIVLGVSGSQTLYAGGRLGASRRSAAAGQRSADIGLTSTRAQVRLDVATAYYDASLTDVLVGIAESTLVQAERAYRQTALGREVGNVSEFDMLRARVSRDNQRPVLVQARGNRDIAYLRLRQLLNVPLDEPLRLTTPLPLPPGAAVAGAPGSGLTGATAGAGPTGIRRDSVARSVVRGDTVRITRVDFDPAEILADDRQVTAAVDSAVARADTAGRSRATARQSRENLTVQQSLVRIARAERLPSLALQANYQRYGYPTGNGISFPTAINQFYPNFTLGLGLSVPVFSGGRVGADVLVAEANLREAEATSRQVEQLASLDAQLAVTQFAQAEAQLRSTAGTAEQAARAYQIAEVRFREGLSTEIELADSRVQLQQAQANAAQAARDREIARLRLTLLRDLPLSSTVQSGAQSGAGSTVGSTTQSGVSSGVGAGTSGTTSTTGAAGTSTTTTTTGSVPGTTTTGQPQTGTGTP
ncbi:MAG TPA: TolC family protein, partial [Gemmatirosa sp.]